MAGERLCNKAVDLLSDWYENNFQTYLTEVETEESLTVGSLTPPVDYFKGSVPDDTRSPFMVIYADDSETLDHRNNLYEYGCTVELRYASDADIEAAQLKMRQYMSAMVKTIASDRSLSAAVVQAIEENQTVFGQKTGNAAATHTAALDINVMIHNN